MIKNRDRYIMYIMKQYQYIMKTPRVSHPALWDTFTIIIIYIFYRKVSVIFVFLSSTALLEASRL